MREKNSGAVTPGSSSGPPPLVGQLVAGPRGGKLRVGNPGNRGRQASGDPRCISEAISAFREQGNSCFCERHFTVSASVSVIV